MCWQALDRRLRIFETEYGRQAGWFIERAGRCVARLSDPRYHDMFWDSYAVEWVTEDPNERQELLADEPFLWVADNLAFRSRVFQEVATHAFAAGPPREGCIIMRGLYLPQRGPWPWEWPLLWWRRQRSEHR